MFKKTFNRILLLFALLACQQLTAQPTVNGLMIDSARLLEQHDYYYRLIDFMAEWDMNTLLFHFSDDHGLSLQISGYEKLAREYAFTPAEMTDLINYAADKKIDIIPELEVFGHTRYITDHHDYHHLYLGDAKENVSFNALDPTNPETISLMQDMVLKVASIFPSPYFHLGCDEVNLSALDLPDDSTEAEIWSTYVNNMISYTAGLEKQPMIWDDHLKKNALIAEKIDKNVILVDWNYDPEYKPVGVIKLKNQGFDSIIMAPSISCWRNRMIPSRRQLLNVDAHAQALRSGLAEGLINTVWLPMRYLQNSMWYGMAYGAYLVNSGHKMNINKFNRVFVRKTFGINISPDMRSFLSNWIDLNLDRRFFAAIINNDYSILNDQNEIRELKELRDLSFKAINTSAGISIKNNADIFDSMVLSAQIINAITEALLIIADDNVILESRKKACMEHLQDVIDQASAEWDVGRYPDDPAKFEAKFPNQENSHLIIVLQTLKDHMIDM